MRRRLLFVSFALCSAEAQVVAQRDVGYVVQVKEVGELVGCRRDNRHAPASAVSVIRQSRVFNPGTGSRSIVQVRDSVSVRLSAVAQVRVDARPVGWHGFFYLSPRVLDCARLRDTIFPSVSRDTGVYYLVETTRDGRRVLELEVLDGSAVVDWRKGGAPVLIRWGSRQAVVTGTKVAVGFDSRSDRSWFYVRDGTALVNGTAAGRGDLFIFAGAASTALPRTDPQLNRDIDFYSRDIFRPVFWKRPAFYVPAVVIAGGIIAVVIMENRGDEGSSSILGIRIPW